MTPTLFFREASLSWFEKNGTPDKKLISKNILFLGSNNYDQVGEKMPIFTPTVPKVLYHHDQLNFGNEFFHSLSVPEFWEWDVFIPFPFTNLAFFSWELELGIWSEMEDWYLFQFDNIQCTMCTLLTSFSFQPNKSRLTLKFVFRHIV